MKTSFRLSIVMASAALLAACGSTKTYTFDAPPGQTGALEYYQGIPTLYSQGKRSIIAVRPATRTIMKDDDLSFHVSVSNAGDRPFDLTARAVSIDFEEGGKHRTQSAYSFDEYVALKDKDKSSGFGMAAMGFFAAAGGALGDPSLSSNAMTNMRMMDEHDKVIGEEIGASDQIYLHRTTVHPGQTHSGLVSFGKLSRFDDNAVTIHVALPEETHTFTFVVAEGG